MGMAARLHCGGRIVYKHDRMLDLSCLINSYCNFNKCVPSIWTVICVYLRVEYVMHALQVRNFLLCIRWGRRWLWFIFRRLRLSIFWIRVCRSYDKWLHAYRFHNLDFCCVTLLSGSWLRVFCVCRSMEERFCSCVTSARNPARYSGRCHRAHWR